MLVTANAEFTEIVVFEHICEVKDYPAGSEPFGRHKYSQMRAGVGFLKYPWAM